MCAGIAAYGDCLADCVKDFDRITFFTVGSQVMINKLNQIRRVVVPARASRALAPRRCKVQIACHFFLSGIRVINLVTPDKCSFIQIERIRSFVPLGPVSSARISYNCPNLVL
jgi:hypothetical protein